MVHRHQRRDDRGRNLGDDHTACRRPRRHCLRGLGARFSGLLHFVYAWQSREARAILWEVLVGILYVFIGGYLLWNPIIGLVSLTFALAIYLFFEAVLEFVLAYRLRPAPGSGWLAVDGVITLILAVLIWRTWPSNTPWVLGLLVGISMLFSGVARLMLSLAAKHVVEKLA